MVRLCPTVLYLQGGSAQRLCEVCARLAFPDMLGQLPGLSTLLTFDEVWKTEKDSTLIPRRMDVTSL